jgi:hypothetical protein
MTKTSQVSGKCKPASAKKAHPTCEKATPKFILPKAQRSWARFLKGQFEKRAAESWAKFLKGQFEKRAAEPCVAEQQEQVVEQQEQVAEQEPALDARHARAKTMCCDRCRNIDPFLATAGCFYDPKCMTEEHVKLVEQCVHSPYDHGHRVRECFSCQDNEPCAFEPSCLDKRAALERCVRPLPGDIDCCDG